MDAAKHCQFLESNRAMKGKGTGDKIAGATGRKHVPQ
jgi:hypothetical protein